MSRILAIDLGKNSSQCMQQDSVSVIVWQSAFKRAGHGSRLGAAAHANGRSLSIATAVDARGQSQLFAVLADGNAYRLVDHSSGCRWMPLTQGQRFTQIAAEPDRRGAIHLLCVGSGGLFHLRPDGQRLSGYADPQSVLAGVSASTMTSNDDGDVEAFAGNATSLNYLAWNADAADWDVVPVALQRSDTVEVYSSYGSDVQLRDAAGAPLSLHGVTITATDPTRITVNGATYLIDAHRAAQVTTNASGLLNIQQPANALATPTLLLNMPRLMPPATRSRSRRTWSCRRHSPH